jgi:hypothetical protein
LLITGKLVGDQQRARHVGSALTKLLARAASR